MNRDVVFAIFVLTLLAPMVGSQQPQPLHDVAVASLEVIGPQPMWINGSTEDSRIRVVIENRGTGTMAYTLTYYWGVIGPSHYLNGDQTASTDASRQPLPPGGTAIHEADWSVQPDQRGPGSIIAVLDPATDDAQPGNDKRDLPHHIPVHDIHVSWEKGTLQEEIHMDELRFLPILVENRGDVAETLSFHLLPDGEHQRLQTELEPPELKIEPGVSHRGLLWLKNGLSPDPFQASYRVRATSPALPAVSATTQAVTVNPLDETFDEQAFSFTVEGPQGPLFLKEDGETLVYRIRNTGPMDDSYTLSARTESDWYVSPLEGIRVALLAGEAMEIPVPVQPSPGTMPGSGTEVVLQVTSDHDFVPIWTQTTGLYLDGPRVQVTNIKTSDHLYEDEPTNLTVSLENAGSRPSGGGTIEVTIEGQPDPLETSVGPLPAGTGQDVKLQVNWTGLLGTTEVKVDWLPTEGFSEPGDEEVVDLFVRHAGVTALAPGGLTGVPGQVVPYSGQDNVFVITNTGNARETVHLDVSVQQGTATLIGPQELSLAAGESRSVGVMHRLPLPATPGDANLTLEVSLVNRTDVRAAATTATLIEDGTPPKILPLDLPSTWDPTTPLPLVVEVTDDTTLASANLTITDSEGNTTEYKAPQPVPSPWKVDHPVGPGLHHVSASAVDITGRTTTIGPFAVSVTPTPVQTTMERHPRHQEVSPGTTVRLTLADGAPAIRSATVLINGSPDPSLTAEVNDHQATATLPHDWGPGRYTIELRVEGVDDHVTSSQWTLVIPQTEATIEQETPGIPLVFLILLLASAAARTAINRADDGSRPSRGTRPRR